VELKEVAVTITQRFTLLVKGQLSAVLDEIEDPERSLHQLICDMEDELEAAKRAAARAIANEDRLRARITCLEEEESEWQRGAERTLAAGSDADARDCLRRAERAARLRERLRDQLAAQAKDTTEIREAVGQLTERVGHAKSRLTILQARLRQGEARRAMGRVMTRVDCGNLYAEFERLSERVEESTAAERAYQRLDDELSGEELRRRAEGAVIEKGVEDRLKEIRKRAEKETAS